MLLLQHLASFACLTTLTSALALDSRQSQRWNDQYISKPKDFKVTQISGCSYLLSFKRDNVDSRYSISFEARYGSTRRTVNGIGNVDDFQLSKVLIGGEYAEYDMTVHQFDNVCSNGASGSAPTAFRVFFDLDEQWYTYRNDWWSDPIPVTAGPVPPIPGNVRATRLSNGHVQVSWSPVQGATGYYVQAQGLVKSEVGDLRYYSTKTAEGGGATSIVVDRNRIQRIAVLARGAEGVTSKFTGTPIVAVQG